MRRKFRLSARRWHHHLPLISRNRGQQRDTSSRLKTFSITNTSVLPMVILLSVTPIYSEGEPSSHGTGGCGGAGGDASSAALLVSPLSCKGSFRSTKLARRARSFKDDFLGRISQISRSGPTNSGMMLMRASSPHKARVHHHHNSMHPSHTHRSDYRIMDGIECGPVQELTDLLRQTQIGLKHLRDVVSKQKLEMLPGNGTIVLDTIWLINLAVKSSVGGGTDGGSTTILSATNRMYQSVARLIKLCDDALIDAHSAQLSNENVEEVVGQVEESVQQLIKLTQQRILHKLRHDSVSYNSDGGDMTPNLELRNSLPDIPLTPRERQELMDGTKGHSHNLAKMRTSHSTESILRDATSCTSQLPPPKPPLPSGRQLFLHHSISPSSAEAIDESVSPPPLPPKKRNLRSSSHHSRYHHDAFSDDRQPAIAASLERVSLEDSISLLSASADSLDSMLGDASHDELLTSRLDDDEDGEDFGVACDGAETGNVNEKHHLTTPLNDSRIGELSSRVRHTSTPIHHSHVMRYHRLSNTDSGIASSSCRSSSYSKRSSQQSSVMSQWTNTATNASFFNAQKSVMTNSTSSTHVQYFTCNEHLSSAIESTNTVDEIDCGSTATPPPAPALPAKTKSKCISNHDERATTERQPSPYDNVSTENGGEVVVSCRMHQSALHAASNLSCSSSSSSRSTLSNPTPLDADPSSCKPPPLPPKKRHIMAYMEMFGNCSHAHDHDFMRHSVHMVQTHWNSTGGSKDQRTTSFVAAPSVTQSCSFSHSSASTFRTQQWASSNTSSVGMLPNYTNSCLDTSTSGLSQRKSLPALPPALPPKQRVSRHHHGVVGPSASKSATNIHPTTQAISPHSSCSTKAPSPTSHSTVLPDLIENSSTEGSTITMIGGANSNVSSQKELLVDRGAKYEGEHCSEASSSFGDDAISMSSSNATDTIADIDLLDEVSAQQWLILKKKDEEGPDVRGGPIDALIIHATKATKNGLFAYQDAFLTTYRTFITPMDLIEKLMRRYNNFYYQTDKKPRSREAFALLVRVVNDLTAMDLTETLQLRLMNFVQQLITCGELTLAKALRIKHLERYEAKQMAAVKSTPSHNSTCANGGLSIVCSMSLSGGRGTTSLLDFKSEHIAEQMTLLDAELFLKIEIPEVLIWAQEQKEERSPNLTKFTEHFNKMSYWARTRILTAESKDIREKYFAKFIKIMKHLRKINNFNSYLALLSALDSAPLRRLEWQKHVQEGLKEYCALIDSSSSFRAYRQALADAQPPCIPYIGLILQDLTFVHIGNTNLLPDGSINFSKRWQQFNIVDNMKKFKKSTYTFKRNERIMQFFQNFDDFIGEDAMWQLSKTIKPRAGAKKGSSSNIQ